MKKLSQILYFIVFSLYPLANSAFSSELPLARYWIQDRFIRTVALAQSDDEKLKALESLLNNIENMKRRPSVPLSVSSEVEINQKRHDFLHPHYSTQKEVFAFLQGKVPENLILKPASNEAQISLNNVIDAYKKIIDYEFQFPPKTFKTRILTFIGFLNERTVSIFDLLFENSNDSSLVFNAIKKMSSAEKLIYLNQFKNQMNHFFSSIKNSGELILQRVNINLSNRKTQRFLEVVLTEYFKFLPDEVIWDMIFLLMENPELSSPMERFKLISQRVGPQFHKLFQILARDPNIPLDLASVFKSFEDSLPPAPVDLVTEKIKKAHFKEFEILEFDPIPVNVASMGQFHKAKVRFYHNQQVMELGLRVLKPNVSEWIERDSQFLHHLINKISEDPILSDVTSGINYKQYLSDVKFLVEEEIDFDRTVKNQNLATSELRTEFTINANAAEAIRIKTTVPGAFISSEPGVMATYWAPGESFSSFYEKQPLLAKSISEGIFESWFESALLGNGFLHADLHAGNLKIESSSNGLSYTVHILDFGMSGKLNETNQKLFYLLSLASFTNNHRLLARSLWEQALKKPQISMDDFTRLISEEFRPSGAKGAGVSVEKAIFFATQNGFEYDRNFIKLIRGYAAARSLLVFTGSDFKIKDVILKVLNKNPTYALKFLNSFSFVSQSDVKGILKSIGGNLQSLVEYTPPERIIETSTTLIRAGKNFFRKISLGKQLGGLFSESSKKSLPVSCLSHYAR